MAGNSSSSPKKLVKSGPSSSKRPVVEDEDRMSTLLPEIRNKILSLLPTIDAARVGLLSTSLRSACYSLSRLSFDFCPFPENMHPSLVDLIDQTITHHDESDVKTLELWLWPVFHCLVPIKFLWVTYAIRHRVEKLVLYGKIENMKLPENLFTCQTLVELELAIEGLVFTSGKFALPNLQKLKIKLLVLSEQSNVLFPYFPALRKLSMFYCHLLPFKDFSISSEKLEEFIMCCPGFYNCALKVQAPCLKTFVYLNTADERCDLDVHPSGIRYVINGGELSVVSRGNNELVPLLIKITMELFMVGNLSLSHWLIEYLFMARDMLKKAIPSQFCRIVRLHIEIWSIMDHLTLLMLLLSRCSNLAKLTVAFKTPQRRALQLMSEDYLVEYGSLGAVTSVDTIWIENFRGGETEMMLVRFLLANTTKLVMMRIAIGDLRDYDTLPIILAYERASEIAEIIFDS